ncbi:hypothetical protein HY214_04925 [Candidatus Roizmanbacteria bacterium]|nr:hypothetical protein [Candidatus Roizmanbacteria bacterium]
MARKTRRKTHRAANGLPRELTTVTPLSRTLAFVVVLVVPVIGFFIGIRYQQNQPGVADNPYVFEKPSLKVDKNKLTPTAFPKTPSYNYTR